MIRVKWEFEEAVALFDLYFRCGKSLNVPLEELEKLSLCYNNRAKSLGLHVDEKFRNIAGIKLQLACVHYVVTDGNSGMSNASKLFYDTYKFYQEYPDAFKIILKHFNVEYNNGFNSH